MKPDQERVKSLLTDTVTLLCKNGLNFQKEMKVQGLLGITLDENEVFLIQINETFGSLLSSANTFISDSEPNGDIKLPPTQSSPAESNSVTSNEPNKASEISTIKTYCSKFLSRPVRPVSRLGHWRGRDTFLHRRKRYHQHPVDKNMHYSSQNSKKDKANDSSNNIGNSQICYQMPQPSTELSHSRIKMEDDDDVIILERKEECDETADRKAMLGSYLAEVSSTESLSAQNMFSDFCMSSTDHNIDLMTDNEINSVSAPFATGLMQNYQNKTATGNCGSAAVHNSSSFVMGAGSNSAYRQEHENRVGNNLNCG